MQSPEWKMLEAYSSDGITKLTEMLLLFPSNNKTGRDMSDLIRGQILGIRSVIKVIDDIEQLEKNRQELKKIEENMRKGAN